MSSFKLGQRVFCIGYIAKTGTHYEVIDAKSTIDGCEHCIRRGRDGTSEEVKDFDSYDRYEIKDAAFDGVYVGKTRRGAKIATSYEEPEYGRAGFYFRKEAPTDYAIIYYALGKKRLVPLGLGLIHKIADIKEGKDGM